MRMKINKSGVIPAECTFGDLSPRDGFICEGDYWVKTEPELDEVSGGGPCFNISRCRLSSMMKKVAVTRVDIEVLIKPFIPESE